MSDLTESIGDLIEFRSKHNGQPMSVEQMAVIHWTLRQAERMGTMVRPENVHLELRKIHEEEAKIAQQST